ncbi:MAG: hypothetical protein M3Z05_01250 [Gemmatimonadota bacterium]|nr:hypothetical protein [Gemmatimonadota bacterium]
MSTEAQSARTLARRLIRRAAAEHMDADAGALAAQDACELASSELSLSLGPPGFHALLRRALVQCAAEYPFLAELRVNRHASPIFDNVSALVQAHGTAPVAAALEAVLEHMFTSLGRLIGEDLVARLVEREVTLATHDGGEPE